MITDRRHADRLEAIAHQTVRELFARWRQELEDAIRLHRQQINPTWHPDIGMAEDWALWRLADDRKGEA